MDFPPRELANLEPRFYDVSQIREAYGGAGQEAIRRVASLISTRVQAPFAIAVEGRWGAGKTTFLALLERELSEQDYPTIWFNPWEYDATGEVVLALQKTIALKLITRWEFQLKELGVFALAFAASGLSVAAKAFGIEYEQVKTIEEDVRQALSGREWSQYEDHVEAVRNDFVKLTHQVEKRDKTYQGKPLVIFLDDLDRCLPDNALRLLEALKNQFVARTEEGYANAIFICGLDTATAKRFIMKKYEGIGRDFAFNYFRKIFNLTVTLPPKTEDGFRDFLGRYIEGLFSGNMDENEAGQIAAYLDRLAKWAGATSVRLLLNVANGYFVCRHIVGTGLSHEEILNLLFLREAWNEFYEELTARLRKAPGSSFVDAYKQANLPDLAAEDARLKAFMVPVIRSMNAQVADYQNAGLLQ
jgi:hypothetical protein